MLKKVTKLLLGITLVLQLISPAITVNASEVDEATDMVMEEYSDQSEIESSDLDEEVEQPLDDEEEMNEEYEVSLANESVMTSETAILDDEAFDDLAGSNEIARLPQASIDAMYDFLASNSTENPFIIPSGLTFEEAINALDWGEGVNVHPVLSGLHEPAGQIAGAIILHICDEWGSTCVGDKEYFFGEVRLVIQYENITPLFQVAIDEMYAFLTNNTPENPLVVPTGLTPADAITSLFDWEENITLWIGLTETGRSGARYHGSISMTLNLRERLDGVYINDGFHPFYDVELFVEYEDEMTKRPTLPQTGVTTMNAAVIGVGALVTGGGIVYYKKKKSAL